MSASAIPHFQAFPWWQAIWLKSVEDTHYLIARAKNVMLSRGAFGWNHRFETVGQRVKAQYDETGHYSTFLSIPHDCIAHGILRIPQTPSIWEYPATVAQAFFSLIGNSLTIPNTVKEMVASPHNGMKTIRNFDRLNELVKKGSLPGDTLPCLRPDQFDYWLPALQPLGEKLKPQLPVYDLSYFQQPAKFAKYRGACRAITIPATLHYSQYSLQLPPS